MAHVFKNIQMNTDEIARKMNSEFVRISQLKHFDYVQVISEKFEGFTQAFTDIMKMESEILSLLKRDVCEHSPKVPNVQSSERMRMASDSKHESSEHIRTYTGSPTDPSRVLNILEKMLSLMVPRASPSDLGTTNRSVEHSDGAPNMMQKFHFTEFYDNMDSDDILNKGSEHCSPNTAASTDSRDSVEKASTSERSLSFSRNSEVDGLAEEIFADIANS